VKICWCEQSGLLEPRAELVNALAAEGIDFYRFNWRHGRDDPLANVFYDQQLSWSLGRSLLFKQARRETYDYYIFADDDVVFIDDELRSLRLLKALLAKHQPLTACLASDNWHSALKRRIPKTLRRAVHSYLLADLEVQILSSFIAEQTFPCAFDGGWQTLWYPNVCVALHAPSRQLEFSEISIRNGRKNASGYYGGTAHKELRSVAHFATFHRGVPFWLRTATSQFGVQRTAEAANALLSVVRLREGAFNDAARDGIRKYFAEVRRIARMQTADAPG
jgi:hypothetical protein